MVLKGTHGGVDGVYSEDPRKNVAATKYDVISFDDVITRNLRVMDMTAITFCKDNRIPIRVFDLMAGGNLERALDGDAVGTLVN
jgi:uridylate kinase